MQKIELSYQLKAERGQPALIRNALMDTLQAVREQGSIAAAAVLLGLSYRHIWGALKNWELMLGQPLIVWEKGQHARLTAFGDKLLWAERQAQARLAPQIEALRGDIERAFSTAFDDTAHVLTMYASHDAALSKLRDVASPLGLHLDIRFMGSVDAIAALNAGRCMLAGFHTLDQPAARSPAARSYRSLLKPGQHKLIGFAWRTQGLIVAKNNPLQISSLQDLKRADVRYVNRAEGAGTRVLFDELLQQAGLDRADIKGYQSQEPSHGAVAQAVASQAADVGLGIEAAAREKALGFVPLIRERYHLVCLKSELASPRVQALLRQLQGAQWQATLQQLPGYSTGGAQSGKVLSLRAALPWWSYRKAKVGQVAMQAPSRVSTKQKI
jgi:putative molybdopterin biosynthesis protein